MSLAILLFNYSDVMQQRTFTFSNKYCILYSTTFMWQIKSLLPLLIKGTANPHSCFQSLWQIRPLVCKYCRTPPLPKHKWFRPQLQPSETTPLTLKWIQLFKSLPSNLRLWYYCWHHCQKNSSSVMATTNSCPNEKTAVRIPIWPRNPEITGMKRTVVLSRQVLLLT